MHAVRNLYGLCLRESMKAFTSKIYLFIHVKLCSLRNPTETHLVFMSNPRKNAHTVPGTSASTTNIYNMENNQKNKIISFKYGMITQNNE